MKRLIQSPTRSSKFVKRFLAASSTQISSPAAAGKRARELAQTSLANRPIDPASMNTLLSHAGVGATDQKHVMPSSHNLPLTPPLEFATTYTRPAEGPYNEGDSIYTRADNPTRLRLERVVAQLELCGWYDKESKKNQNLDVDMDTLTCAFASGMMAASSLIMAHQLPLTVLLPIDLYHGVSTVLADVFADRFGVKTKFIDMTNISVLEDDLKGVLANHNSQDNPGSIMVWMETPSNPCCHVLDVAGICEMVDRLRLDNGASITTVVDSTLAPSTIQQPLKFGADVVMHSGTKYFGGHSDVLLGITTASPVTPRGQVLAPLIRQVQQCVGGVASPMDSWLTMRGLRTLHVRVALQCQNALMIAEHLSCHSSSLVTAVHYPGLKRHPQYGVARRQMKNGYGGVLSLELDSEHTAMAFAGALQTIYRATSLGGTETLIEHRASIEPANRVTSPPGLLRMAVGLEDSSTLIRDIDQALEIAEQVKHELAL